MEFLTPRRVVLADDKQEIRSALRLLLEEKWSAVVVGEAADSTELLAILAGEESDGNLGPLVVLDWELPGLPAGELLLRIRELSPRALIAALSSQSEAECAAQEAGADFFVSKSDPPERVLAALAGAGIKDRSTQAN